MREQTQRSLVNASEVTTRLMFGHNSVSPVRTQLKTCFSVDIRVGMVREVLVGLLPERLSAYRYNDLKTDLHGLLEDVPAAVRCSAVVERHLRRKTGCGGRLYGLICHRM